ncbi:hypothetical protein NGB36_30395 [Streptomyces sp. RB6PN25]|uniref:PH domain-containing protein n=1 Tax=Streptomyces humicola TaxID=2953240 RepID=A0ABT1Q4E1_9ACTN|nr:hypothetical protein [Streptomyces humicola]MCQ4084767.1 hypothetical protein [Streptomyces humicola]
MTREPTDDAMGAISVPASAGQGLTGQRLATVAAALVLPVLVVVPGLLARAGLVNNAACVVALASPVVAGSAFYFAHRAGHTQLREGGLLTAHTVSGRRSIDLTRLTKVGRIEIGGRGKSTDRLTLTDAHGVRLYVDGLADGGTADAAVVQAVRSAAPGTVTVSKRAALRMRLQPATGRPAQSPVQHAGTAAGSGCLTAFLPLLLSLACVPVAMGALLLSLFIAGVNR